MSSKNKKPSLLPRVKKGTMSNIHHRINKLTDRSFYESEIKIIKKENPLIAKFINGWWCKEEEAATREKEEGDDDVSYGVFCGLMVYRMLASQAEADKMNEELGL
jgi:hypothetical protein